MDIRYPFFLFSKMRKKNGYPLGRFGRPPQFFPHFADGCFVCGRAINVAKGNPAAGATRKPVSPANLFTATAPDQATNDRQTQARFAGSLLSSEPLKRRRPSKPVMTALQMRQMAAEGPWQARLGAIRPQRKQESRPCRSTSSSRPQTDDKRSKAQTRLTGAQTQSKSLFKMRNVNGQSASIHQSTKHYLFQAETVNP